MIHHVLGPVAQTFFVDDELSSKLRLAGSKVIRLRSALTLLRARCVSCSLRQAIQRQQHTPLSAQSLRRSPHRGSMYRTASDIAGPGFSFEDSYRKGLHLLDGGRMPDQTRCFVADMTCWLSQVASIHIAGIQPLCSRSVIGQDEPCHHAIDMKARAHGLVHAAQPHAHSRRPK